MIHKLSVLLLFLLFVLTGCVQQQILDELRLATAVGYEISEDGELEATSVVPTYKADKTVMNEVFIETAPLSKEIRRKLDAQSSKPFVSGKIQVTLYSKEIAEKGLLHYLDTLTRDPAVGSRVYLAIVEGSIKELLMEQYGTQDNGMYLADMIEHNVEGGILPKTNLHKFLSSYYADGQDPFLPILIKKGKKVKIDSIALFKKDKMIEKIQEDEIFTFKALMDKHTERDSIHVKLNEDDEKSEFASVYKVRSKKTCKMENIQNTNKIKIDLDIEAIIREYTGEKMTKKIKEEVEKNLEKKVKKQAEDMIKMFQELNIDPLGIGEQARSRTRIWDKEKWEDTYPNLDVMINVNVILTETGVIE